jgi:anti-sigma regulatory factor (Ser/Thr protein kinase)
MKNEILNEERGSLFPGNNWQLSTDIRLVKGASEEFNRRLIESGWKEDEASSLEMAFEETLINAIVHGNLEIKEKSDDESWYSAALKVQAGDRALNHKKVYVSIDVTTDAVSVTVRDEGNGFDWKKLDSEPSEETLLKPSGRGNLYMKLFFDSVEYNEKGNEVTLRKKKSEES